MEVTIALPQANLQLVKAKNTACEEPADVEGESIGGDADNTDAGETTIPEFDGGEMISSKVDDRDACYRTAVDHGPSSWRRASASGDNEWSVEDGEEISASKHEETPGDEDAAGNEVAVDESVTAGEGEAVLQI